MSGLTTLNDFCSLSPQRFLIGEAQRDGNGPPEMMFGPGQCIDQNLQYRAKLLRRRHRLVEIFVTDEKGEAFLHHLSGLVEIFPDCNFGVQGLGESPFERVVPELACDSKKDLLDGGGRPQKVLPGGKHHERMGQFPRSGIKLALRRFFEDFPHSGEMLPKHFLERLRLVSHPRYSSFLGRYKPYPKEFRTPRGIFELILALCYISEHQNPGDIHPMRPFYKVLLLIVAVALLSPAAFAQRVKSREDQVKDIKKLETNQKPKDIEKAYELAKAFLQQFGQPTQEEAPTLRIAIEKYRGSLAREISRLSNSKRDADIREGLDLSRKYIAEFGTRTDGVSAQIRRFLFDRLLDAENYAEAFDAGMKIIDIEADDLYTKINMAFAGYQLAVAQKDRSFVRDTVEIAKEAVAALDEGKTPREFIPYANKDDALANLYFIIGSLSVESDLRDAAKSFRLSLTYPSELKGSRAFAAAVIAFYLERAYQERVAAFKEKYPRGAEVAVADAEEAKQKNILDGLVDAYSRAVNYGRKEGHPGLADWQESLKSIFAFRRGNTNDLDPYVDTILTMPIPEIE
jgi:hypothetical protein